jgi:two-component sensor histidine kinase
MIIPFVLITLVENAFKHGDLQKQEYPINIKLDINRNKLYFYCSNKKKSGPKELSTWYLDLKISGSDWILHMAININLL